MTMSKDSGNWLQGDNMYFYVLDGGSYEEYYKTVFKSETKYSKEEFMEIIKDAYRIRCEEVSKEYDIQERCDYLLKVESILWEKEFKDVVSRISELEVIKPDEKISVGTGITPNTNTRKIERSLLSSDLHDCKNDCRNDGEYLKDLHCKYIEYIRE